MKTEIAGATLYHGNSLEIGPTLGPKFADHTIADPPYEAVLHDKIGGYGKRKDARPSLHSFGFDAIDAIRKPAMEMITAATKNWALMFCIAEGAGAWEKEIWASGAKYDTLCFWHKPDGMPRINGDGPARACECISTAWCGEGRRFWNAGGKRGFYSHLVNPKDRQKVRDEKTGKNVAAHPTEKPVSLMRELILDFTQPGDLIFDPFMGIGSTGVAAIQTGRRFVGIELQESHYQLAVKRIQQAVAAAHAQPVLFNAPQMAQQADFGGLEQSLAVGKAYK